MARNELKMGDTAGFLYDMSEGNPGAVRVLMELLSRDGFMLILSLDDMNIRGTQIWVAFKDFAGEDVMKFEAAIRDRDPAMVEVVNAHALRGNHDHLAVTSGASYPSGRKMLDRHTQSA